MGDPEAGMSDYVKYRARREDGELRTLTPAKPAKVAPNFSRFRDFSAPVVEKTPSDAAARREWADALCRQLSDAVAQTTTPQVREWEPAWQLVEVPSRALLDALAEYEASGTDQALERAAERAELVLCAWRDAAALYDGQTAAFERWSIKYEGARDVSTPNRWDRL
jgi:hypothetical protein